MVVVVDRRRPAVLPLPLLPLMEMALVVTMMTTTTAILVGL